MIKKKISQLDLANASLSGYIPMSDSAGTVTNKVTVQSILDLAGSTQDSLLRSLFVPSAPTNLSAIAGNAQVVLSWTAPTATYTPPITDYVVQFKLASASSWETFSDGISTATSATVTGLTNGSSYMFRVGAVNGVGTSEYSSNSGAVTPTSLNVAFLLHFDGADQSTSFVDSSPMARTVTAFGSARLSTAQKRFGSSSLFVGGNSYATVPSVGNDLTLGTNNFTLEFWMRDNGSSGEPAIITTADPVDGEGIWVGLRSSGTLYWLAGNGQWAFEGIPSTPSLKDGAWHHIAYVRSGASLLLFLDGQLQDQRNIGESYSLTNTNGLLRIGGRGNYSQYFNGWIDEVRLVIGTAVYVSNFTPPSNAFPDS